MRGLNVGFGAESTEVAKQKNAAGREIVRQRFTPFSRSPTKLNVRVRPYFETISQTL
jgi:hypothetical protein